MPKKHDRPNGRADNPKDLAGQLEEAMEGNGNDDELFGGWTFYRGEVRLIIKALRRMAVWDHK